MAQTNQDPQNAAAVESDPQADQLRALKETYIKAASTIDKLKEPMEDLISIRDTLREANQSNRAATDEPFRTFLQEDLAPGLAKRLFKERSNDDKYLEVVAEVLEVLIRLFALELKEKRYSHSFYAAMVYLFQFDSMLHRFHYQIPDEELRKLRTSNQDWRTELKEGDKIDVYTKADERGRLYGWMQAEIARVDGDSFQIEYLFSSNQYDRSIGRWSTDIAQFESKTKEDYEWRHKNLVGGVDFECDMHDKATWNKGTIFRVEKKTISATKSYDIAYCAFRVYREASTSLRKDERGTFEGWSEKFDEWIPLFSPRIMPWQTRVGQAVEDDADFDDDLDNLVTPEEGLEHVFAVPRVQKCISAQFLHFINVFGNLGGFDLIIDVLENGEVGETTGLDINVLGCLAQIVAAPYPVFHKAFIEANGAKIAKAIRNRLLSTPDKALRDVRKEQIDGICKAVDNIGKRYLDKAGREKQSEILKLEMCKKGLASEFLERRIQGIRDLNQVIKNNTLVMSTKSFSTEFLIDWMKNNEVFDIIWDGRKTHLQLVQRSNEILKLLLKEDMLTSELLEQFWNLAKSDYKEDVFKIINEVAFYFKQSHVEFLFSAITQTNPEKLTLTEFDCLCELGKFCKSQEFQKQISDFFWGIVVDSEQYKEELVDNCTKKFSEMVKYWALEFKKPFFDQLVEHLKQTDKPALPLIRLFTQLISDQKERSSYGGVSGGSYSYSYGTASSGKPTTVTTYASHNVNGSHVTSYSNVNTAPKSGDESIYETGKDAGDNEETKDSAPQEKELTFDDVLNNLETKDGLVQSLLDNLAAYNKTVAGKVSQNQALAQTEREKIFIVSQKHSHHQEIEERLQFLNFYASNSDFKNSKVQLKVIYDLLSQSPIPSDTTEFLSWCKKACESSKQILDLNEVGEFFSELIATGQLNVRELPLVGFEFISHYFISVNENASNLLRIPKKEKKHTSAGVTWKSYNLGYDEEKETAEEENPALFKVVIHPDKLEKTDLIWTVVLNCQTESVIPKAIDFLIKTHMSLDEGLYDERSEIQQSLISKCMKLLNDNPSTEVVKKITTVLQFIIQESEKKGAGDVHPHNAILKGECLDRIIIKNNTIVRGENIIVRTFTSCTVWEFRSEVSKMLDLGPRYVSLKLPGGRKIKDSDNGKVIEQLGLKNGDVITAKKIDIEEEIPTAPLVDRSIGKFTPRADKIFNEWFTMYSNSDDVMTPETCCWFMKGATNESVEKDDNRIKSLFSQYDGDKDDQMQRSEFLKFYYDASVDRERQVRDNLKNHFIRADLKKLSEVTEEVAFAKEQMPRFTLSSNNSQFDTLMKLLDRNDEASPLIWELIRMLATNQVLYKEVLTLENSKDSTGNVDWNKFFKQESVYKQIYNLEIIEAVMEEGDQILDKRVEFVSFQDGTTKESRKAAQIVADAAEKASQAKPDSSEQPSAQTAVAPVETAPKEEAKAPQEAEQLPALQKQRSAIDIKEEKEQDELKESWTSQFLQNGGFNYVLDNFLASELKFEEDQSAQSIQFKLKHTAFMLTLLRVFLNAAFTSHQGSQGVFEQVKLARKSSSVQEEESEEEKKTETKSEQHFNELMAGPEGLDLLESIDYLQLQGKLLNLLTLIVQKEQHILEDKFIVENAMNLWLGTVLYKPELFADFLNFKGEGKIQNAGDLILAGVLYCPAEKIRENFMVSLSLMAKNHQVANASEKSTLSYLIPLLSENFSKISEYSCNQFFDLFNGLIDFYFLKSSLSDTQDVFNPEDLLSQIIDKIRADQSAKKEAAKDRGDDDENDDAAAVEAAAEKEKLMVGLINLTSKIITKVDAQLSEKIVQEKDLINEIFKEFLFASVFNNDAGAGDDGPQPIVVKKGTRKSKAPSTSAGSKSREAAYTLLNSLIKKSPVLMNQFVTNQLSPLMQIIKRPKTWNYTPASTSERYQKYVGLRNLGCICYMNSMMQQFFMIPAFRYNLLCVDDGKEENIVEYKGEKVDDNMLHQMQKLIAHLELSERTEYNPFEFCFSFKEFDGNPTNVGEQKDAQEFLNIIFDRVENALKPTPKKYLLQSIFGGKTCSQLVCQECGKVKNRMEDYYNLSLTVKNIKSVYDSLQQMIEGEVINDYHCDGCDKKVDISKRTLIAETPNVLIVHLQRIVFNFDTFNNDKLNSYFDFPEVLDLKPYSYFEVMEKEHRLKNDEEEDDNETTANTVPESEGKEGETKEEEENPEPIVEDCFEYKLVGVNVHSGSANAGHYWSYINTNRGTDEIDDNDPNWIQTSNDVWMEYNDSTVKDFKVENLKEECFGDENSGASSSAWSFGGGAYGKSGYMLFYERRRKKDLKILVADDKVDAAKEAGIDVQFDEEKKEHFKFVKYREGVDNEAPNNIYQKVFDDNSKFTFENDVYSSEFFDFIKDILTSVAGFAGTDQVSHEMRNNTMKMAQKVCFDILARCFYNQGIKQMVDIMIQIFEQDDQLCKNFVQGILETNNGEPVLELLLDCPDIVARVNVAHLFKFLLARLKEIEKEELLSGLEVYHEEKSKNEETGEETTTQMSQPAAISARFLNLLISLLTTRASKSWTRFDNYLDLLMSFGLYSAEEIKQGGNGETKVVNWDSQSEAARIGLEYYAQIGMAEKIGDFILGEKSPLCGPKESRVSMGGSYSQPNFSAIMTLLVNLISDEETLKKYPLSEATHQMIQNKEILNKMMEPAAGSKGVGKQIVLMCKDNFKMSKKIAKVFIKGFNQTNVEKVSSFMKGVKKFLMVDDSLKQQRLEWIFGVPQIVSKKQYRTNKFEFGAELVERINDEAYTYNTSLMTTSMDDGLFTQLIKCRGRMDTFCVRAIKDLLSLCKKDETICRYVYTAAPPTYQYARYSDWFRSYLEGQKAELEKTGMSTYTYYQQRIVSCTKAFDLLATYEEKCAEFAKQEKALFEKQTGFENSQASWMAFTNDEVLTHYPPQYIVGKQINEEREILVQEDEHVKVILQEIDCEYIYSNPTGMFNLSQPSKLMRTKNYTFVSYAQFKELERKQAASANNDDEEPNAAGETADEAAETKAPELEIRDWEQFKQVHTVLLRLQVINKTNETTKIAVVLKAEDENEDLNVKLPETGEACLLYRADSKVLAHYIKVDPSKQFGRLKVEVKHSHLNGVVNQKSFVNTNLGGTGFVTQGNLGVQGSAINRRNGIQVDMQGLNSNDMAEAMGYEEVGGANDWNYDSNDNDSNNVNAGSMNGDLEDNTNDPSPVTCIHCDELNNGMSLHCSSCKKVLTQYTY